MSGGIAVKDNGRGGVSPGLHKPLPRSEGGARKVGETAAGAGGNP
jgi:hypothetical protein